MATTYQDLVDLRLPEWKIGEIVNGELAVRRLPRPNGTNAHSALLALLRGVGLNGSWRILARVELRLGADVLVPDLSGWRRERMPVVPNAAWMELPPDWVCDVLTDSSLVVVRDAKPTAYARHGIAEWWIIDADEEAVEVRVLNGDRYESIATFKRDAVVRSSLFDTLDIELHHLWG